MFKTQSMTIAGLAVMIFSLIVTPGEAETIVNSLVTIIDNVAIVAGIVMTYYGRYRKGDIDLFGIKKV